MVRIVVTGSQPFRVPQRLSCMVLSRLVGGALLALAVPALPVTLATGAAGAAPPSARPRRAPPPRSAAPPTSPTGDVRRGMSASRSRLPQRVFAPRQLVTYQVSLHNLSGRACGPAHGVTPSAEPRDAAAGRLQ